MASASDWIDRATSAEILEIDVRAFDRVVAEGLVGIRQLPGVRAKYRKADVEALKRLALVPPTRTLETARA